MSMPRSYDSIYAKQIKYYESFFPKIEKINWDRPSALEEYEILNFIPSKFSKCRLVLIHYYGFFGEKEKNLAQIGRMVGRSLEGIRQAKLKMLRMLRLKHPYFLLMMENEKLFRDIVGEYDTDNLNKKKYIIMDVFSKYFEYKKINWKKFSFSGIPPPTNLK